MSAIVLCAMFELGAFEGLSGTSHLCESAALSIQC